MTEAQTKALKGVSGLAAIVIFTMGADWALELMKDRDRDVAPAVTETRFIADSIRTDARFEAVNSGIRAMLDAQRESNSRLREICERLRAGCR